MRIRRPDSVFPLFQEALAAPDRLYGRMPVG